jgi:hypothetical protein
MSDTYVWDIDDLLHAIENIKKDGYNKVITSVNSFDGMQYSPSERKNKYKLTVALHGDIFTDKSLTNITGRKSRTMIAVFVHDDNIKNINTSALES